MMYDRSELGLMFSAGFLTGVLMTCSGLALLKTYEIGGREPNVTHEVLDAPGPGAVVPIESTNVPREGG